MTPRCDTCHRPQPICVCDRVTTLACSTRVVVLQHPQEPDEVLGTAQILAASLPGCTIKVGLSWPNLAAALGEAPAEGHWGVLWTGSLPEGTVLPAGEAVVRLDRHGEPLPRSTRLTGVIALDGTWSQAKTLWWRNPWLLRLDRVILQPVEPGLYGSVRKEPRREAVSTLEAVADTLVANGEDPSVRAELRRWMRTMVQRARDTDPRKKAARPTPPG